MKAFAFAVLFNLRSPSASPVVSNPIRMLASSFLVGTDKFVLLLLLSLLQPVRVRANAESLNFRSSLLSLGVSSLGYRLLRSSPSSLMLTGTP